MKLRAKKPEVKETRIKALIYADRGVGKTHFCCSLPDTYYIDTENLEEYPHFVKMIRENRGDHIYLTEIGEIIKEVKALLSIKNDYKTLVIDSISFPYGWLSQLEAERLAKGDKEGTEYGANLAKAKRLTFHLGILLSRLDMNVIVTSHERIKYEKNIEVGKIFDISDKMAYALGSVWRLALQGQSRKLYIEKSRPPEMRTGDCIDFDNGYEVLKSLFGEEIFSRESKIEELATKDQVSEFNNLIHLLKIDEETIQKILMKARSQTIDEMPTSTIQKCIDHYKQKIQGEEKAA